MVNASDITADAIAIQERDRFCADGWLKLVAPAKVNLHLQVGARRADGYHDVDTVMHAVNLHDIVYLRFSEAAARTEPAVQMVACGDVPVPDVAPGDNLASRAVTHLAEAMGHGEYAPALEIRIEKHIPFQAGLGGGSADAAAALVGAAQLWGVAPDDPVIEQVARTLGADVAFFLHGGCAQYGGIGNAFVRDLEPSRQAVALVKPDGGVSTADAYRVFDEHLALTSSDSAERLAATRGADRAEDVSLFNNLAPAVEALMPELADIRLWLTAQPGVQGSLLCGSGAATFALCASFDAACGVVAAARKQGLWARATSLGTLRALPLETGAAR